jgi:hypothetical protein
MCAKFSCESDKPCRKAVIMNCDCCDCTVEVLTIRPGIGVTIETIEEWDDDQDDYDYY